LLAGVCIELGDFGATANSCFAQLRNSLLAVQATYVLDKWRDDARDESKTAAQIEDAVVRLEILGIGLGTGLGFSCTRGVHRASIPGRSPNHFRPERKEELYDY